MKLITMGTGHGEHTDLRFNSSNVLEINDDRYIIEAGVPIDALYIRKYTHDFSKVRAVFITHMHRDHVGGLPNLIGTIIRFPKEGQHTHIYLPEDAEQPLKAWMKAVHYVDKKLDNYISFHLIKVGEIYRDENVRVKAFGTNHMKSDSGPISFAFRFETENKSLVYTGDLAEDFHDFPADDIRENGADLCVCECQHYKAEAALEIIRKLPIKRLLFNHVSDKNATKEGADQWLETFAECEFPITIAQDGDEYNI